LGLDHQAWKAHTFWRALLEHAFADFAYKTNGFFNGFEMALLSEH